MNKIYKVIWSHIANAFVVVSELATTKGKAKSTSITNHSVDCQNDQFKLNKIALFSALTFVSSSSVFAVSPANIVVNANTATLVSSKHSVEVSKSYFVVANHVKTTKDHSSFHGKTHDFVGAGKTTLNVKKNTHNVHHSGATYHYAGKTPKGVITVGHTKKEHHHVKHVTTGVISQKETHVITGSQVYAITRPLRFGGDNSVITNPDKGCSVCDKNVISRVPNQALDIRGGEKDPSKLTTTGDKNIGVIVVDHNSMEVRLSQNLTNLTSATFTNNNNTTIINQNGVTIKNGPSVTINGINVGNKPVTNVSSNLTPTYNVGDMTIGADGKPTTTAATTPTKSQVAPTPAEAAKMYNNAATVGDVLNAGWNLKDNGQAVDFVKPYDTVNFANGTNTAVNVASSAGGKANDVRVNVVGLPISYVNNAGDTLVQVNNKFYKSTDVINGAPKAGASVQTPAGTSLVAGNGTTAPQTLANVASSIADKAGSTFSEKLANASTANPNNAVNVSDLKNTLDDLKNSSGSAGNNVVGNFGLKDQDGKEFQQSLGTTAQIVGDKNINTKVVNTTTGGKALEVSLNPDVQLGKDGVDGTLGVNGKDGSAVVLNGKDGSIGLNGKDGANGLTFKSANGKDGVDGKNGANGKTRIVYETKDASGKPSTEEVATLNDGLKFGANNGTVHNAKLNTQVNVKGADANTDWAKFDAGKNVMTQVNGNNITVALAKNLTAINSITLEKGILAPTYNTGDLIIGANGKPTKNTATTPTKSQTAPSKECIQCNYNKVATVGDVLNAGWNLQNNGQAVDFVKPYDTVNFANGTNTAVSASSVDGKTSDVRVNVVGLPISYVNNAGDTLVQVNNKFYKSTDVINGVPHASAAEQTPAGTSLVAGNGTTVPQTLANVASSIANKAGATFNEKLANANTANPNNAVNVNDLKNALDGLKTSGGNNVVGNFGLKDQDGNEFTQALNTTAQIVGDNNINTKVVNTTTGGKALEVSLNPDVQLGQKGEAGKDGVDGKIGVNGKDGSAIVLNGKDGSIGLNGANGKDGLTLKSANGKDGVDGKNGTNGKTRIVYETKDASGNPTTEEVATLNDGLKFGANNGTVHNAKLNTQVNVKGADANTDWAKFDEGKNIMTQVKGENITVALAKDLDGLNSISLGNGTDKTVVNKDGITIAKDPTNPTASEVKLTEKGLNNGNNQITNVKGNLAPTYNAGDMTIGADGKPTTTAATTPTKSQVAPTPAEAAKVYNNAATVGDVLNAGWNLQGNGEAADFVKPYDTVNFANGTNTAVNVVSSADGKTNDIRVNVVGLPISYVNAAGDTLVKVGDNFYKASDVVNGVPNTGATAQTPAGTSLVAGNGTTAPQTLANVASSIANKAGADFGEKLANANATNPNNAVNVSDLKGAVDDVRNASSVGGFGLKDEAGNEFKQNLGTTAQIVGDNNINTKVVNTTTGGKALEVSLNPDVQLGQKGEAGKDGVDGKIGVNGKDGSAVVLNGKDGSIGLNGANGKDGLTFKAANGKDGVDGKNGTNGKTRIVYETKDASGNPTTEEVATLNDGLKFGANNGTVHNAKLNTQVNVKGADANTDWAKFDEGKNIMTQVKGENITVALAKDLDGLNSISLGNGTDKTVVNKDGITIAKDPTNPTASEVKLTEKGLNNGNNQITNVKGNLAPTYNAGDMTIGADGKPTTTAATTPTKSQVAPTPAEAAKVYNNAATVGDVLNAGWNLQGNGEAADFVKPYDTVNFANGTNTAVNVVSSADGKTNDIRVNVVGLPISYVNAAGDTLVKVGDNFYKASDVVNGVPNTGATAQTPAGTSLVAGNGTTAPQTLANVASSIANKAGADFGEKLANANVTNPNNAVNVSDLKGAVDDVRNASSVGGFGLKDEAGNEFKQNLGTTAQIVGDNNINTKVVNTTTGGKALEVSLNPDVQLGQKGEAGKDGVDGKIGVNGKDGSAIVLNGKDGSIGLNGANGKDGLTFKAANGKDGVDGKNGTNGKTRIVYETKDANGNPTTEEVATLNDGLQFAGNNSDVTNVHKLNSKVNIVGEGVNKTASATFQSAAGNINVKANGTNTLEVQLNKDINLTKEGSVSFADPTTGKSDVTLNSNGVQVGDTKVAKDGVSVAGKDGKDAVTIKAKDGVGSIGLTGSAGKDGKNAQATIGVEDGAKGLNGNDGKDGESKTRLVYTKPNGEKEQVATMNDGLTFEGDTGSHKAPLGTNVKVNGDGKNITTKVEGNAVKVQLNDNIEVKGATVKENLTVEKGANVDMGGNTVNNVADGEVSATSKQAVNGSQLHKVQQQINNSGQAINQVAKRVNKVDKDLRAGIAGANAAAGLPQVYLPGKSMVAASAGTYRGESAVAVGYSRSSDNGKLIMKLQGNTNTRGDVGGSVGVGYQW